MSENAGEVASFLLITMRGTSTRLLRELKKRRIRNETKIARISAFYVSCLVSQRHKKAIDRWFYASQASENDGELETVSYDWTRADFYTHHKTIVSR